MTKIEISKRFIQSWQAADWDSYMNLLSEDIELEILGLDYLIKGKKNVIKVIESASGISFNQNTKINNLIMDDIFTIIELESTRSVSFLKSPFPEIWNDFNVSSSQNLFRTAIILEWHDEKCKKIKTIDTLVHPSDFVADELIAKY